MKKFMLTAAIAVLGLIAQPVLAQPKIKSKKEGEAWQAVASAATADARMAAAEDMLVKFADTELKPYLLQIMMDSAMEKGDNEKSILYAERVLEGDPKAYTAMLTIARITAQQTKEFDLDKEEKLKKVDKMAGDAVEQLKVAVKPNPQLTDEQWLQAKGELMSQGHEARGMAAMIRKKYDDAIGHFKESDSAAGTGGSNTAKVRLAAAYNFAGKHDEAIAVLDPMLKDTNLNPAIRQFAAQEKVKAATAKMKK